MSELTAEQRLSISVVESFFDAKERRDWSATMAVFADDVVYEFPMHASGEQEPWFRYDGKQQTGEYQQRTIQRFSRLRMFDVEYTPGPAGRVVFATTKGDYVQAEDGRPYNNVYVFKFTLREGKIVRVDEYVNPVPFAKLAGLPLG